MAPLNSSTPEQLASRVDRFLHLPSELPWIEFKENSNTSGPDIAKYVSALGNSATLHDEPAGYLVWGISDDRRIVGTTFDHHTAKGKGNEDLLPWLRHSINPTPDLRFDDITLEGKKVVLLRIPAAQRMPYTFDGKRFIRDGSYTKDLLNSPDKERNLWKKLNQFDAENQLVADNIDVADVDDYLSIEAFFSNRPEVPHVSGQPLVETLQQHGAVTYSHELGWCIPAWSALMYAHNIADFVPLQNLAPRVLQFNSSTRTDLKREWTFNEGYVLSFPKVMELIETIQPGGESIDPSGRRVITPALPGIAFREVYANALMHQNLEDTGKFITVEVFADHIDVTNPGQPLVDPQRFIDAASTTRNPTLGEALRQAHFVEQRGSGWDKIVSALEKHHFPPALIRTNGSTTVTLSAFRPYSMMSQTERIQAVYQHACLRLLENQPVNNTSVRARFGLKDSQASQVSRLLKATTEAGLIKPYDPAAGPKTLRYIPFWAD